MMSYVYIHVRNMPSLSIIHVIFYAICPVEADPKSSNPGASSTRTTLGMPGIGSYNSY